ncbi:MAG: DEAD/DEAH box helicase, partial [Deltaproteobacteria bacterium]|nr:DEAD/DEAH box helicase [Deltaproteobacteria bacterium]
LRLQEKDRVVEGELLPRELVHARFGPAPGEREWCDTEVLKSLKRRSLARLRKQVEPVDPAALSRFALEWQGLTAPRRGLDALLTAIEQLEGAPIPASALDEVLRARVSTYKPADLDLLCAQGEVMWRGLAPIGSRDGRLALYLTDHLRTLAPVPAPHEGDLHEKIRASLKQRGASFFSDLQTELSVLASELLEALWDLVWTGELTNDTLQALRNRTQPAEKDRRDPRTRGFRSRRAAPPGSEGRWSLLPGPQGTPTSRSMALAQSLLLRHGVLSREAVHAEGIAGGFAAVYEVLKTMEESARARRGYFVAGMGAMQFALPGAEERLRALREVDEETSRTLLLPATDPANVYGATLPWPETAGARPQRAAGAEVIQRDGRLIGWLSHGSLLTFLAPDEPARGHDLRGLVQVLKHRVDDGHRRAVLITRIDGAEAHRSPLAQAFGDAGFSVGQKGLLHRQPLGARFADAPAGPVADDSFADESLDDTGETPPQPGRGVLARSTPARPAPVRPLLNGPLGDGRPLAPRAMPKLRPTRTTLRGPLGPDLPRDPRTPRGRRP